MRRKARPPLMMRVRHGVETFTTHTPARFAIVVFTLLILLFTGLLSLPISSADGTVTPLADAFFTAVSTICVTGLSTVTMATHWSLFGHLVIVTGLQIGGIGVLTLASLLGLVVSRRLGLRAKLLAASDSNPLRLHHGPVAEGQAVRLGEVGGLLATVAISVFVIEAVVAALIAPRLLLDGHDPWMALWHSIYYAISAFTNTGFVPSASGLSEFAADPWMLSALALGVFAGALGFPVIFALAKLWRNRGGKLTLHVKLTLITTVLLAVAGFALIYLLEWANPATLGAQDPLVRPMTAGFLSVMTRSGGFSPIDISELHSSTLVVMDMLMFVGGGSASTAGGIKVTTLAVLFLAAWSEARGDADMQVFGRRIPKDVLRLAISVVLWGASIVAVSTIALLQFTEEPLDRVLFDVISAFATCGLSTGVAGDVDDVGKYILAATMWAGRVGTVTLAAALAASQRAQLFKHAEERPIVG